MSEPVKPSWLENAVTAPVQAPNPNRTKGKKALAKTGVAKTLAKHGLTITLKNGTEDEIVDVQADPDECWEQMKKWSEGRALSESARMQRDAFVLEFVIDFNGIRAASRCGSTDPVAMWRRMERCPYVQRAVGRALDKWEASARVTRDHVVAGLWREANDFINGSSGSRVAALGRIAKIMGIEVDNINVNVHKHSQFVDTPLTREEFNEMRIAFDEEF